MNLTELLKMRRFDTTQKIKLIKHQDPNYDTNYLYKHGMLEFYQSIQSNDVFRDCDYILSFIGDERTKATFIGAYRKIGSGRFDRSTVAVPADFPYMEILEQPLMHYNFERIPLLDDLVDRLVIDWGTSRNSNMLLC